MEKDFFFDVWRQFISQRLNLNFQEQVIVVVLQEILDVVFKLRLQTRCFAKFFQSFELRVQAFLLYFIVYKHRSERPDNNRIKCDTNEHPDACDGNLIVIVASEVSISDRGERLECPIESDTIAISDPRVDDASIIHPGIWPKIVHLGAQIEKAREQMHSEE
jgi:hypothetical protein